MVKAERVQFIDDVLLLAGQLLNFLDFRRLCWLEFKSAVGKCRNEAASRELLLRDEVDGRNNEDICAMLWLERNRSRWVGHKLENAVLRDLRRDDFWTVVSFRIHAAEERAVVVS